MGVLTLGELSDLIWRDLAETFAGGLYARAEALGYLGTCLGKVDVVETGRELVPPFHGCAFDLLECDVCSCAGGAGASRRGGCGRRWGCWRRWAGATLFS